MTTQAEPAWDFGKLQANLPKHVLTGSMRYTDFQPLGHGGKAEVFRCRDVNLGREVAYKVLHHTLMRTTLEQQMLAREARIMASLDHVAVPHIHDLGRDGNGRPYFTMAFIQGPTLHELLQGLREEAQTTGDASPGMEELISYLLQVAETLQFVHEQGIVHGDIKPENLVIGHDGVVRIIDWGLARLTTHSPSDQPRLERLWGRQGSPLYMSPEQVAGESFLQPSSDLYSLAVLLYECLTLKVPLQGSCSQETLELVATAEPARPSRIAPQREISPALEEVCMRGLSKSATDRFRSMDEFCEALRECHLDQLISFERDW